MFRPLKMIAVAAAGLAGLVACDFANAQWGYAPYSGGYGPAQAQTFGYQTAYPGYGQAWLYDPAAVAWGYNTQAVPRLAPRHARTSVFGVYRPYGAPEVTYRGRRDGSVRIDVDD